MIISVNLVRICCFLIAGIRVVIGCNLLCSDNSDVIDKKAVEVGRKANAAAKIFDY